MVLSATNNSDESAPTDLRADHLGALLLAAGIACVLDVITAAGRAAAPAWPVSPLLPLVFFVVALLAFYRHRWTRLYRPYGNRAPIYLAELILLVLVTRLVPLLATPDRLLASLPRWWADPLTFFDPLFLLDAVLVGAAWLLGHTLGGAVDQLHLQSGELPPPRDSPDYEHWERSQSAFDHRAAQRQISNLVLGGGAVAIVGVAFVALSRADGGLLTEAGIAVGIYLMCGLLLLGWAHVTLLDTLWRADGQPMPTGLSRRWPGWLVLVLVIVAVLALIAPRSYALDPLALIFWLLSILVGLVQLILFLIMLPFIWLASLLGLGSGSAAMPAAPPPMPPPAPERGDDLPFLALLRSLGFWLVTLALAVYSLRVLYQSRWGALRLLPRFRLLGAIGRLWRSLLDGLRDRAAVLAAALRPGSGARAAIAAALRRPPRPPRPTDPRGLVQFLYLSLIERAGRRGLPRRRGMTAAEYSRFLATRLDTVAERQAPTAEAGDPAAAPPAAAQGRALGAPDPALGPQPSALEALDVLTAAFLEARYSRHPVGEGEVSRARRALQRLLSLIRRPAASR